MSSWTLPSAEGVQDLIWDLGFKEFTIPPKEKQRIKPKLPAESVKAREAARSPRFQNPFTRKNYLAFAVALGLLAVGYICLAQPPADGFLSKTLAPILLVAAYAVVFPYAIMAREKPKAAAPKLES